MNIKIPRIVDWTSKIWGYGLRGNLHAIQELFSQGIASPWDVQAIGGSVLHCAADHGHWELCKFLAEQGATLDNEDDFNNTPTSLAREKVLSGSLTANEESIFASVFANTDYLQTRQCTILHQIVLHLIPRELESELEYSTKDLDAVDASGLTCLSWASARGDEAALETLLAYGADINFPDGAGNKPLHHVKNVACGNILLASGASTLATAMVTQLSTWSVEALGPDLSSRDLLPQAPTSTSKMPLAKQRSVAPHTAGTLPAGSSS